MSVSSDALKIANDDILNVVKASAVMLCIAKHYFASYGKFTLVRLVYVPIPI